jgi:CBS domain containing-hemolysin-like protein
MTYNLIIVFLMLIFSALFSGMEIAFVSSNKLRIELDKKQGHFFSKILTVFTRNPEQYIATMLVGNNFALVIYGLLMVILLEPLIHSFTNSEVSILICQTILSTLIILITAEFLPKALFRINPNSFLNFFAVPMLIFYILLYPLTKCIILISNFFLKNFFSTNINSTQKIHVFGKIDLDNLVNEAQKNNRQAPKNDTEIKIFQNALDFSTVKLRDCMIPRTEIEAVNVSSTMEELQHRFITTGYSKILVYEENIDNIVGYISSKELFKNPGTIQEKLVKPLIVPETMPASKLLKLLMQDHKSVAVVVDEFGGTAGMLTIEDILEEIFGEIEDEHDTQYLIEKKTGEDEFLFSGRLEIEYLNEKYSLHLPESDEYETIAGLILAHHQSMPKLNERIVLQPFVFKILKVSNTRVELIQLSVDKD